MACRDFAWSLTTIDLITVGFIVFKLFDTVSQAVHIFTRTHYGKEPYQYRQAAFGGYLETAAVLIIIPVAAAVVYVRGVVWHLLWDAYSPQRSSNYIGVWLCDPTSDEHYTAHYTLYVVYYCIVSSCVGFDLVCILWALLIAPAPRPQHVRV